MVTLVAQVEIGSGILLQQLAGNISLQSKLSIPLSNMCSQARLCLLHLSVHLA